VRQLILRLAREKSSWELAQFARDPQVFGHRFLGHFRPQHVGQGWVATGAAARCAVLAQLPPVAW
jgi:hypothetical protein